MIFRFCFLFIVGTLTIPVMNDSKQVRVSSISSGIVGQPIIFTSMFIYLYKILSQYFVFLLSKKKNSRCY